MIDRCLRFVQLSLGMPEFQSNPSKYTRPKVCIFPSNKGRAGMRRQVCFFSCELTTIVANWPAAYVAVHFISSRINRG
jgi:hypothetical protein